MSALGQNRTSSAIAIYVRYWGLSGHNQFESGHSASAPSMVDDLAVMDDHRIQALFHSRRLNSKYPLPVLPE